MATINIYDREDPEVQSAKDLVQNQALLSWVLLFEGDRWHYVKHVAIAMENGTPIGLASLSPCDEEGKNGPQIIGVWVAPGYRRHGIGSQLVKACADEAVQRYGQHATIYGVSSCGVALVRHAEQNSIPVIVRAFSGILDLP